MTRYIVSVLALSFAGCLFAGCLPIDEPGCKFFDAGPRAGEACKKPCECMSDICDNGICQPASAGYYCLTGADCLSGTCSADNECLQSLIGGKCRKDADCETCSCSDDQSCDKGSGGSGGAGGSGGSGESCDK